MATPIEQLIHGYLEPRLAAIEYMARQLYSAELRRADGDSPLENALATQGAAMMGLRRKLDQMPDGETKARMITTVEHINRIYEELVRGFEGGSK